MRGEALAALGQTAEAARAYLDSFSGSPEGDRAPEALLRLAGSLGKLGQVDKGCVYVWRSADPVPRIKRRIICRERGTGAWMSLSIDVWDAFGADA